MPAGIAMLRVQAWPESARSLGMLSLMLLMALLPHVTHLPIWIPLCVTGAMVWRLWIEVHAAALPNKWLRSIMALLALMAVLINFRSLNGLEAGTALLSMMAGMKLLESRQLRDYSILIFIALFLLFAEMLYEQSMILLPYLLLSTTFIVTCLLHLHDGGSQISFGASLIRSTRMLLQALPLAALLFLLVPRLPGQFWVLPSHGAATTGLNDEMSPGDVADLSLSSEVAFRVEFQGTPPPKSQRYWRAVVLHDFDGRTWRRHHSELLMPQKIITSQQTYRYRMLMEPSNEPWIPVLDIPLQTSLRRSMLTSDLQLLARQPVTQLIAVDVLAATEYQFGVSLDETMHRLDTQLAGSLNPRSRELALQMRAASNDDSGYVNTVLNLFRQQDFFYTLQPPALGAHTVDDFLFNTRQGFCEHYASAFTFMMRAAGIPARVVTGYQGGELNEVNNYLVVRQSDAHAWSEVWLADRGWVRVDPTAAIAPQRIEQGLESAGTYSEALTGHMLSRSHWLYQMRQNWDAVNTFWKARIVNFDSDDQRSVMSLLGFSNPDWRTLGWALLISFISFFAAMMLWLGWKYRPRQRDPVVEVYATLKRKLSRAGIDALPHEGPVDYLSRAALAKPALAGELRELCDLYITLRYTPDARPHLLSRLRQLVRQLPA